MTQINKQLVFKMKIVDQSKPCISYFFVPLFLVLLFSHNSIATTLEDTFQKRIAFDKGGYLSLSNFNGDIEVSSWDKLEVEIIAHKRVRALDRATAQKLLQELEVVINRDNSNIEIKTQKPGRRPGHRSFFDWLFGDGDISYSVSYELKVPYEIDLNIDTSNGNILLEDIKGRIRMHSTNGKLNAQGVNGLVQCNTTNGSIRVEFEDIPLEDEISFTTTNGSIKLYLPKDYSGEVDLKTTNGKIVTDFALTLEKKWSRRRLKGTINEGGGELYCSTTNGNIYLYYNDEI
jgi:DUF4097 and DUF4098 domain-containing protein YvlB